VSKFFGKPTEKIIEFMLFFVISGWLRGSILVTRGSIKRKIRVCFWLPFLGRGPGGLWDLFGCFSDAFWYPFGSFLVAFWKPLGAGLLELLGSCGKGLGCFSVFFIRFLVFIQPVLSNVGECLGLGGWGGGGRVALHMLCKVSLLALLVSTFACIFMKIETRFPFPC